MVVEISNAARAVEIMLNAGETELAEEKICIVRDAKTGEIAWKFNTAGDPYALMVWAMFHALMQNSGYAKRIADLEAKLAELGGRNE